MVEVGTWSLLTKVTPKKNRNQKNSTVSDREFDSLSDNEEFFDLRIFSLCELLWVISTSEFVKVTVNTAKYARNTLLFLICINAPDSRNPGSSHGIGIPYVNYIAPEFQV